MKQLSHLRKMRECHILDPPEEHSKIDCTSIEYHFQNPTRRSPPTVHNSPTTCGNYMKKAKNTLLNGKFSDRQKADSNQTLCAQYVT